MTFTWDPLYGMNLLLCIIIFVLGVLGNRRSKSSVPLLIGIAFGLFGVSHLATPGHHIRCYPAKATDRYLLLPKRGVEFVDLKGDDHMRHNWLRAPCGFGVIAANRPENMGLLIP